MLLVTGQNQADLNEILAVSDTCALDNLVQYVRPLLPDYTITTLHKRGIVEHTLIVVHGGIEWNFTGKGGQEVWFRTSEGVDSRDIILAS